MSADPRPPSRAGSPVLAVMNLPSAVTLLGVLGGGAGLWGAASGHVGLVVCGIAWALATDKVDGMLARRLKQQSDFGAQLDSLSDSLAFVVTPAFTLTRLAPGAVGMVIAGLYLMCGVSRLAAFHGIGLVTLKGRVYFVGVPTPAAASVFLVCLSMVRNVGLFPMEVCLAVAGPLMISSIPWPKRGFHDIFCAGAAAFAMVRLVV